MNSLTLDAILENIPRLTEWIDGQLEAMDCPMKVQYQIDVAVDEIFSNIAHYAYPSSTGTATITLEAEPEQNAVVLTFVDHGVPFDPIGRENPDVSQSVDERKIGGLGLFIVKKTMDDVSYEYKDGANILRIRKKL